MRSTKVKVYDDEWESQGTGLIYQSLSEEDEGERIESALWGRFLDHLLVHRDTDWYLLHMGEEKYYVGACDCNEKWFHSTLFPVCENSSDNLVDADGKQLNAEAVDAYKARNVYLKMIQRNCTKKYAGCDNEADFVYDGVHYCRDCWNRRLEKLLKEKVKQWNETTQSYRPFSLDGKCTLCGR